MINVPDQVLIAGDWHGDTSWATGAVSVDRSLRTEQRDWWAAEALTDEQADRIVREGHADVILSHDAPAQVPLRLPPPSKAWAQRDLERADRHREVMQSVVDAVTPQLIVHGHYHLDHDTTVAMRHGQVRVRGLDCEDSLRGNIAVLDTRTLALHQGPTVRGDLSARDPGRTRRGGRTRHQQLFAPAQALRPPGLGTALAADRGRARPIH